MSGGEVKLTPGWHVEPNGEHFDIVSGGYVIARVPNISHLCDNRAHADMIAAAPETAAERDALKLLNGALLTELTAARTMLEAIEAHMVNTPGLRGVDHADEGKRIRAALQLMLSTPSLALSRANGVRT